LLDLPASLLSEPAIVLRGEDGILYFEDFDAPPPEEAPELAETPVPKPPEYTAADVDCAYEAGRKDGLQAALSDARLVQDQLRAAATQALADALAANRRALEQLALHQANETAQLFLAIIAAAIPYMMTGYGQEEVQAVVAALLPGMRCEAELRVRTHPNSADMVRETLAEHLMAEGTVISVMSDTALAARAAIPRRSTRISAPRCTR